MIGDINVIGGSDMHCKTIVLNIGKMSNYEQFRHYLIHTAVFANLIEKIKKELILYLMFAMFNSDVKIDAHV